MCTKPLSVNKRMNQPQFANIPRVAVVGGGAAGLMCACLAAENGADVTLFEKNRSERTLDSERYFDNAYLGKKLLITGKGRCNVTNACTAEEFTASVISNPKFLYAAFRAFPPEKVMAYFENLGVPLKTERGGRVFPVSDKALDVLRALKAELKRRGVHVINRKIEKMEKTDSTETTKQKKNSFLLTDECGETHLFDRAVVCTGGLSYPQTGSTGDGFAFAEHFGHTVTDFLPSLVPLECEEQALCSGLSGLSLKNVTLSVVDTERKKTVYSKMGEMLFTHFGISGPLVLSASAHMRPFAAGKYRADIDLKPALDPAQIDARLVSLFETGHAKNLSNLLGEMLPKSMTEPFCRMCGLSPDTKPGALNKSDRRRLAENFKRFSLHITAMRPMAEAIVTSGGVNVKQINPSTMESKLTDGLYFAGEVMDVDAYTGGFNLQIAFSTAYLAAKNAAQPILSEEEI